jgi:ABC-type Fe3+/spermidine/putrescine transport system ATPase subunit
VVYAAGSFRLETSLDIPDGDYFVLMGPTGSGKTATVECLAGLRRPLSGRIEMSGKDMTWTEPRDRMVGYVPQDYALFGHRTVRRNIAFGPEVRGWSRVEVDRAVETSARFLGIEGLLDRRIPGLSGGERQRVAVARALAMRPRVLILDEPVSALDESTRETVCTELRRIQRELKLTTIHISHNLEEAFSVADRAAVMRNGRVEQVGTMEELLRRPRNEFVARFMRCENIFEGRAVEPGSDVTPVRVGATDFLVPGRRLGTVRFVVRPENVMLLAAGEPVPSGVTVFPVHLVRGVDRGAHVRLQLNSFMPLVSHLPVESFSRMVSRDGGALQAVVAPASIHVLPE